MIILSRDQSGHSSEPTYTLKATVRDGCQGRPLAVAKRRSAPFTAVSDSGRLNKGRALFPKFPDEPNVRAHRD